MEHKAVSAITRNRNSKYFFSYAKKFSIISTALGPLIDMENKVISCPQKMADMLDNSVFSIPKEKLISPDRFPAILLKQCKSQLAKPLFII